jgi:hypothetical protein
MSLLKHSFKESLYINLLRILSRGYYPIIVNFAHSPNTWKNSKSNRYYPIIVNFALTYGCNGGCIMCLYWSMLEILKEVSL